MPVACAAALSTCLCWRGSCHLLPHAASLLRLLFLAVWSFAATALPEAPSGAHECAREWVVGAQAGGCLSTPPSAQLSLRWLSQRPRGTQMVTLPQCIDHLPRGTALPSRPTLGASSWPPISMEAIRGGGFWSASPFLLWVSPAWYLLGVQTCGCALEKTLSLSR